MNLRIPDYVVFRILDNEAVILNLASGVYFGLDRMGTRMWQLVSEHGSIDKVVAALLDEYDAAEDRLRQDLNELTRQLIDKGLIKADAAE